MNRVMGERTLSTDDSVAMYSLGNCTRVDESERSKEWTRVKVSK